MNFGVSGRAALQRGIARLAAAGLAFAAQQAYGQDINPQAGASAPTRDDIKGVTSQQTPAPSRLTVKGDIERSPCPLADPQYANIKIKIADVTFGGLKETSPEELAQVWQPYVGTEQSVSVLCEIRDAAGTALRNRGYLAAVQVPTQKIEDGRVRMEVLYARISSVRARGETKGAERKLQQYLGALTEGEVFNINRAERYLLLARDLPGYNVQLTLRPAGTGAGDLVGEVSVLREPYAVDLTLQNLASEATGRFGGQVRAQAFGITGLGDVTSLSYYATQDFSEQHILQGSHEFRPGRNGLIVGAQMTYAWTNPNVAGLPAGVRIEARTLFASLYARYPLKRAQAGNRWLSGGLDLINQDVDFIGPLSRDKVRVGWARFDMDGIDLSRPRPAWRYSNSLEVRQGLAILDATNGCTGAACVGLTPPSRTDGSRSATTVRWQGEYERSFGDISFLLAPRAQYAFKPLLSFEEFSAGNFTIGRGYDPGELIGDDAMGSSAEMRGPRFGLSRGSKVRIQPFVYFDAAWVWNKDRAGSQRLTSAGGGIRSEIGARFRLDATLAVPLEKVGLQALKSDPRFLLTLTTRLLPWSAF
ncbi:hemolysin [Novosphingobium sp. AAP83]|uniref:ShlB/FhaC/HecB family hemolysin secretion/activation protein n=1 Tax=Novosphingobium sp. AAP83 TaxID=1523425 RepID=UPI0006B95EBC|nr:ShlB/FhaC/HecB family hemolysin secretion/activation protein [Novosphingobium sp. AAP83]KPF93612.1 hemolysin [Novosphingobium sp. AAP83]